MYVIAYGIIPTGRFFWTIPAPGGWILVGAGILITSIRAWPMGVRVDPETVVVRNFWRRHVVPRKRVVAVEMVDPLSITSWFTTYRCPCLRLDDGRGVLVIAGGGAYRPVYSLLQTLGVPVDELRSGVDFGRLLRRLTRRDRH